MDVWKLSKEQDEAKSKGGAAPFFLLQTNYDHWTQPPSYDDRRDPGIKHMDALGVGGVGFTGLLSVMKMWPTFNHHVRHTRTTVTTAPSVPAVSA